MKVTGSVAELGTRNTDEGPLVTFRLQSAEGRNTLVETRRQVTLRQGQQVEVTGTMNSDLVLIAESVTPVSSETPKPTPVPWKWIFTGLGVLAVLIIVLLTMSRKPAKDACLPGFVWRGASLTDHVCVHPATREQTQADNRSAKSRVSPTGGPYGKNTCLPGFVWREAFPGDVTCVTPATRQQALEDNRLAPQRRAAP